MPTQSGLQSGEQMHTLLAQRRQVATDATKGGCSPLAAEGARDLLLDLDHTHITLRLVIVKRHGEAVQESQHGLLVIDQTVQQVACRTLFGPTFAAGRSLSGGGRCIRVRKELQELGLPVGYLQGMQCGPTLRPRFIRHLFHIQQQGFEVSRPLQMLFFCQEGQFAQQMYQTERMRTGIQEVRTPTILDAGASKARQDADRVQGCTPWLGCTA
jgi:hypothetical protein